MENRVQKEKSNHDKVIEASAETWRKKPENVVHTNPSGQNNFSVNEDNFPDVVIVDSSNNLKAVEEIETESSVTEEEKTQWEKYASFGARFNLIIPTALVEKALKLTESISNVYIQSYHFVNGEIKFVDH